MSFTARQVTEALKHRYRDQERSTGNVTTEEVAEYLRKLPVDALPANNDLLACLATQQPEWSLGATDAAVLSSTSDCLSMFSERLELDPEIMQPIRAAIPPLAAHLLNNPTIPVDNDDTSVLTLLDLMIGSATGWSADQGRSGQKFLEDINNTVESLRQAEADIRPIQSKLQTALEKELSRTAKLEDRLAASEAGKIRSQRSRAFAGEMINKAMEGKQVTEGLGSFLKGPWYESMQLIAINHGIESDEWIRASKITQTLIWTYQPQSDEADKQRLYRIIEHLPEEVGSLLLALEHSDEGAETVMAEIEDDHVSVVSGQTLEYVDWEPIEVEQADEDSQNATVDRSLLKKVRTLEAGQWFLYNDGQKQTRIKLVLKLEDVKQLLFTNRNGMKALEKNFEDMAYLLTSDLIRPVSHHSLVSTEFCKFYLGVIEAHEEQQKMDEEAIRRKQEEEAARQREIEEEKAAARAAEEERERRRAEFKADLLDRVRSEASKPDNQPRVDEVTQLVEKLNVGAWLKLPNDLGELVECKLAVKVASKMIFVDTGGDRVCDHTAPDLVAILVCGEGEIQDAGVEFEDTLAQVVNKLRDDREKSFDDLTGAEN